MNFSIVCLFPLLQYNDVRKADFRSIQIYWSNMKRDAREEGAFFIYMHHPKMQSTS